MKTFQPMLFTSLKTYSKKQFIKDLVSGIIVAIIALPLSIALALASGVSPEQGLYTAMIAGFLISFFGGSTVQIAGPTAAFATIVAGIVANHGSSGLAIATIMAGIFLIIMGFLHFGSLIKYIPFTITTGFTAGVAVTILVGQLKDFFGLTYPSGTKTIETMEKIKAVISNFETVNLYAILVGLVCLGILIVWPKISERVPGSLVAVIVGILMVKLLNLPVNTIGDLYDISNSLPRLSIPQFNFSLVKEMLPDSLTIAILAAIESLLSCVVADGMVDSHHRSNTELIGQGIGNIGSALFGGIPATGAIARTAANIKNGGRTPVSGLVHAIVLTLILVILMPYAKWIPMPTIAAILFQVAYNMSQWRTFVKVCKKAPKSDIIVLIISFALTVVFDLVVAIEIGMLAACILFVKRASEQTGVHGWTYKEDAYTDHDLLQVPLYVRVYEVNGSLFFGAAENLKEIYFKDFTKCLIIRMKGVNSLDITALNVLEEIANDCKKHNVRIIFSHVNKQPMHAMEKAGFIEKIGEENFRPNINDAIEFAKKCVENK